MGPVIVLRFDYEGLDPRAAFYMMRDLEGVISDKAFTSQKFAVGDHIYSVEKADNFEYIDPVDGTVARNQVSLGAMQDVTLQGRTSGNDWGGQEVMQYFRVNTKTNRLEILMLWSR